MISGAVSVGYLHPGSVRTCFANSLKHLLFFDASGPCRIVGHDFGEMGANTPPTGIVEGRNRFAKLMCDHSEAEWLFMVDSDMAFEADIVDQLIAVADPDTRPVLGGLAFAHKTDGAATLGGIRYRACPTLYRWFEDDREVGFVPMFDYPRGELVEVSATGGACLLIHRTVFEKMRAKFGDVWFDPVNHPKHKTHFSEDLSFCLRLAACDIPLFVHTGIKTGHDKGSQFLDEAFYDDQRSKGPTAGTIDVIIPTYQRPHRLAELHANITANTVNEHQVVFVVEEDDEESIKAVRDLGLEPVINERTRNYAGAVNTAYLQSRADWVFCGADDLTFHPAWDVECLTSVGDWFPVIGTNDLLNHRVLSGVHATHALVNRRYLDEVGGVADEGPNSFLFEGYDHNFVDTEFINTAKMRGRFRPCLTAVVEHMHYLNGKAPHDATYERSMKEWDADEALYASRVAVWAC